MPDFHNNFFFQVLNLYFQKHKIFSLFVEPAAFVSLVIERNHFLLSGMYLSGPVFRDLYQICLTMIDKHFKTMILHVYQSCCGCLGVLKN